MTGPPPPRPLVFRNPNPAAAGQLLELAPDPQQEAAWSLFVRDSDGLAHAVGDFRSLTAAHDILRRLFGNVPPIPDPIGRWS
jgi:hypothetical protein